MRFAGLPVAGSPVKTAIFDYTVTGQRAQRANRYLNYSQIDDIANSPIVCLSTLWRSRPASIVGAVLKQSEANEFEESRNKNTKNGMAFNFFKNQEDPCQPIDPIKKLYHC
jgi:hypothetical protein